MSKEHIVRPDQPVCKGSTQSP